MTEEGKLLMIALNHHEYKADILFMDPTILKVARGENVDAFECASFTFLNSVFKIWWSLGVYACM